MLDLQRVVRTRREIFADGRAHPIVYLVTNRLGPLRTSALFSNPATILRAEVGGSVGRSEARPTENWGPQVGDVSHRWSERDTYKKSFVSVRLMDAGEASLDIGELLADYRGRRIRNPVVRSIQIRRNSVESAWMGVRTPRSLLRITADQDMPAVRELMGTTTTFDMVAACQYNPAEGRFGLDEEIDTDTARNAQDPEFIQNVFWPSLGILRGNPVVSIREQIDFQPGVIPNASYLQTWVVDRDQRMDGWTVRPV
jgi:hypothetical protein